jgi:hypothetical protein
MHARRSFVLHVIIVIVGEDQVLVAVLTAAYNKSDDTYGYNISQSSGQTGGGQVGNQTVIEDILGGEDSKTIENCNLFIDDLLACIGPSFIENLSCFG